MAFAHFLRIVGGECNARGWDFHQRRLDRGNLAAEAGGVEDDVVAQVMIEILLRLHAVARIALRAPEFLVAEAADAPEHRGDAAAEMRHVDRELRMAVENAGID